MVTTSRARLAAWAEYRPRGRSPGMTQVMVPVDSRASSGEVNRLPGREMRESGLRVA